MRWSRGKKPANRDLIQFGSFSLLREGDLKGISMKNPMVLALSLVRAGALPTSLAPSCHVMALPYFFF